MLKLDGAFAPFSNQRGTGFCRASFSPPERFVPAQLSGGLKVLYKHLGNRKKDTHKQYGSQTSADGKFQPCYPVPLLSGRYKFVQVIGQGQSSILVAAEDTFHPDKKPVAVKIMHLDYSRLGAQEADCIQQLNKADILHVSRTVQLFNVFSFEGHYCLVFELLRPRPLHQYFQKCQFDNEEAKLKVIRKITLQLLQALGFLKRENVIHADLKPENILFEEGEEIKIKVVDFGNAIHWVHREVSLYYDEFELQTLLYRAPEVMFGVPFGPEIDMWSLGCILAELYIGKPLFLGRNKIEIMQEVTSVLSPVPRNPFQTGKFFQDLSQFVGHNPEVNQLVLVANLMKKLHNSRNYAFANFLVGLLHYNPSKRLTPSQAAMHPFLAPDFPFAYLLPQEGSDKISDAAAAACYTDIFITPEQYISKPHIDEDIKRQHFSGTELLKRGTTILYNDHKISFPSLLKKQKEENEVKNCSLGASVNSANMQCSNGVFVVDEKYNKADLLSVENSRYAMEGPLTTSKPTPTCPKNKRPLLNKEKVNSGDIVKKERATSINIRSALPTNQKPVCGSQNNNSFSKLDSPERSDLVEISQKKTQFACSYNKLEGSSMKLKSCRADTVCTSQRGCYVAPGVDAAYNVKDHLSSENNLELPSRRNNVVSTNHTESDGWFHQTTTSTKTRLDLDKCSSFDETNVAARTRVYYRKTKYRKLDQPNDLSSEIKCSKHRDHVTGERGEKASKSGHKEHSPSARTSVVHHSTTSQRIRKKQLQLCQDSLDQDSNKTGPSGKYQDDVVVLL